VISGRGPLQRYSRRFGSEGLSLRGRDDAERLGDVVKFHWEAVAKDGKTFGVGLNFLVHAAARGVSIGIRGPYRSWSRRRVR
jgi:hypothetical protein